ncbi:MAG TPA: hypothetical protein ENI23_06335 [bacterium]|nr:hypothetical protein [bacterium]
MGKNQYVFPIKKDFDYFDADDFRTKKLEGTVELRNANLPGADAFLISPKLYIAFKRNRKFPKELSKELQPMIKGLIKDFSRITVRTCFRFSGYENPRALPAFRDLKNNKDVLGGIKNTYKAGEDFAKENEIGWFELGLIIMGRVEAEKSGIILVDPEKSNLCTVETCWGDVHLIAVGENDFDSFWVDDEGDIKNKVIRDKKSAYYFVEGKREKRKVPQKNVKASTLLDDEIKELAKNAFEAAKYHKTSVEIEYMVRKDGFIDMYELQERPGLHLELPKEKEDGKDYLVSGTSVNGGQVQGKVKVVTNLEELKQVHPGQIMVLPSKMMGEDIPIIGKIGALVTDTGGLTAHISTIAKESNVPCIVGTGDASKKLKDGMEVTVDATAGKIYLPSSAVKTFLESDTVLWLEGLKAKLDLVGGKAANLINLLHAGIKVPDAYVITTQGFDGFIKENKLKRTIDKMLSNVDIENLGDKEEEIKNEIMNGELGNDLKESIVSAFDKLKQKNGQVSIRSSATSEDSVKASFAGQFQSFLFIDDEETLVESIKRCWASLFRAGAVLYAIQHGLDVKKIKMAVIVQEMIDAEVAGVMFTKGLEGSKDNIVIEAAEGIGENVVSGEITPTTYNIDKKTGRVMNKKGENKDVLSDKQISGLVALARKIETFFGSAQDIEWAIRDKEIYILQSRPITT